MSKDVIAATDNQLRVFMETSSRGFNIEPSQRTGLYTQEAMGKITSRDGYYLGGYVRFDGSTRWRETQTVAYIIRRDMRHEEG